MVERCKYCGKSKADRDAVSITQWLSVCTCEMKDVAQDSIKLCATCNKRIAEGRIGSMTQWIFRTSLCKCENPVLKRRPDESKDKKIQALIEDLREAESESDLPKEALQKKLRLQILTNFGVIILLVLIPVALLFVKSNIRDKKHNTNSSTSAQLRENDKSNFLDSLADPAIEKRKNKDGSIVYRAVGTVTDHDMKKLLTGEEKSIDLCQTAITNKAIDNLNREVVIALNLAETKIDDGGLKKLSKFNKLVTLTLTKTLITDAGLKELKGMKNLQVLNMNACKNITDKGIREVSKIQSLRVLDISSLKLITANGIKFVSHLPNLNTLGMRHIELTEGVAQAIVSSKNLKSLSVGFNVIDFKSAKILSRCKLIHLEIWQSKITDKILDKLTSNPSLQFLHLNHCTGFTDEHLKKIENTHPDLTIKVNQSQGTR